LSGDSILQLKWRILRSKESASNFASSSKTAAETHRMPKEAFRDNAMSQSETCCGSSASRTDERLSTTLSVVDDRRQAQHRKTSQKCARLSLQILGELSMKSVRSKESIRRKRPDKWKNNWFLPHENAPAQTPLIFGQFVVSKKNNSLPPYSPGLTPCDTFLFPKMKLRPKGICFDPNEEIQA
jgi:hypothetical protein